MYEGSGTGGHRHRLGRRKRVRWGMGREDVRLGGGSGLRGNRAGESEPRGSSGRQCGKLGLARRRRRKGSGWGGDVARGGRGRGGRRSLGKGRGVVGEVVAGHLKTWDDAGDDEQKNTCCPGDHGRYCVWLSGMAGRREGAKGRSGKGGCRVTFHEARRGAFRGR